MLKTRLHLIFKNTLFPFFLIIIISFIAFKNYVPGTFLSGWDTLHPEFNLQLYLKRIFFGVWQEHQGVGALASQSHISDITRFPLIYGLSLFLPLNIVRYSFFFLTLFLGSLGVYFFCLLVLGNKFHSRLASFIASLAYLLNLYTVQQYYVPLEMFATYFACVPWLFYSLVRLFKNFSKGNMLIFALVSLFSSSMAHTPTLFYTFGLCFLSFFIFYLFYNFSWEGFRKLLFSGLVYLSVNLFWILPNLYFLKNGGDRIVENSRIHLNFTPEAFLQSKSFGDFRSLIDGKNFLFNWREFDFKENTFVDLLDEWQIYLPNPLFYYFGIVLFSLSFFGVFVSFLKKKGEIISLFPSLVISIFFLFNSNPPLGNIFDFLRENYPTLREALRFPFTKFSFTFTFPFSVFLGSFIFYLFDFSINIRKRLIRFSGVLFSIVLAIVSVFSIFYRSVPVFDGYLISPSMKVDFPDYYFQMFKWFSERRDELRIAKLPLQTHWGWGFYDWGYQGAGFTWFGLKQPTFDREFDRWSPYNESFYNEASYTLYKYHLIFPDKVRPCQGKSDCKTQEELRQAVLESNKKVVEEFERVLEKYKVSYLLLDESIINAGGEASILYLPQIKDLISHSEKINEVARFGFLSVYRFAPKGKDLVQAPSEYWLANADLTYSKYDPLYQRKSEYVVREGEKEDFPFVNFDFRGPVKISLNQEKSEVVFENKKAGAKVVLPIPEKIEESFGEDQGFKEGYNCDLKKKGKAVKIRLEKGNFYGAYDGGVSCDWFYYPTLDRSRAYLLYIRGKNLSGRGLKIYLYNTRTKRMDLEELLPSELEGEFENYFVVYPSESQDVYRYVSDFEDVAPGYTLNVETRSFGKVLSENIIEDITFIPIDIDWFYQLSSLEGQSFDSNKVIPNNLKILDIKKYGTWFYKVKVEEKGGGLFVLGQGYEKGWMAFKLPNHKLKITNFPSYISGIKFMPHVRVNSWENGWLVSSTGDSQNSIIYILYWPQVLEWVGFGFLTVVFLAILAKRRS
jgi:hypothetical protein